MTAVTDESTDMSDTMQHAAFVQGIDMEFNITVETVRLKAKVAHLRWSVRREEYNGSQFHNMLLLGTPKLSMSEIPHSDECCYCGFKTFLISLCQKKLSIANLKIS
jgi:hypothetical protein